MNWGWIIPLPIHCDEEPHDSSSATWANYIKDNKYDVLFVMQTTVNSKRSHIQKGCFICPGNINKSINEIMESKYSSIIKYVDINKDLYKDIYNLLVSVNISHSTLYGGIVGYSNDIKNRLLLLE